MGGNAPRTTYFNPSAAQERNKAEGQRPSTKSSVSPLDMTMDNVTSTDPLTVMVNPINVFHNLLF